MKDKKLVKTILKNFDFEKVHIVMTALNWGWHDTNGEVPSVPEMKTLAKKLLKEVLETDNRLCATGGFEATYQNGILELKFVVSEWNADKEDSYED